MTVPFSFRRLDRTCAVIVACAIGIHAAAQPCTPVWQPGTPGTNYYVFAATEWDPDGPGPLASGLVLGGAFQVFSSAANGLVFWDGATYTGFGNRPGVVRALAVLPDGDLVAAGEFAPIDGVPGTNCIARWDIATNTWTSMGGGVDVGSAIESLAVLSDGRLAAVGLFQSIGGSTANGVAIWDGASWTGVGTALDCYPPRSQGDVHVKCVAALPNGEFVIGGFFERAGATDVAHVARWTGSGWVPMGFGFPSLPDDGILSYGVTTITTTSGIGGTRVIVGAAYTQAPTYPILHGSVAAWNGSTWDWLGGGYGNQFVGSLNSIVSLSDGSAVVGGGIPTTNNIAKWNGASWADLAGGVEGGVYALHVRPNQELVAGGTFLAAGGQPVPYWARLGGCPVCDSTDFNGDGLYPDTADIDDFLSVFSGGPCGTGTCADIDFNNDGLFPDTADIDSLLSVFSGGPCM